MGLVAAYYIWGTKIKSFSSLLVEYLSFAAAATFSAKTAQRHILSLGKSDLYGHLFTLMDWVAHWDGQYIVHLLLIKCSMPHLVTNKIDTGPLGSDIIDQINWLTLDRLTYGFSERIMDWDGD